MAPSDFAFLWDECTRCFYNKVVLKKARPRSPFPTVFRTIDGAMKERYLGERAQSVAEGAPRGEISSVDQWVRSVPMTVAGCVTPCVIRGRADALVACDDGTTGVIDFKTNGPSDGLVTTYGRQLHAYARALEHPASSPPTEVGPLGLLCFSPRGFEASGTKGALLGDLEWIDIPRDDEAFQVFLTQVVSVLELPEPPPATPDCVWCSWGAWASAA